MRNSFTKTVLLVGVILLLYLAVNPLLAQNAEPKKEPAGIVERFTEKQKRVQEEKFSQTAAADQDSARDFIPDFTPMVLENKPAKEAMFTAFKAYYEYRTKGFEHRKRVFAWQLFSAKIIFFVVIFLVLVGVYFSWVQFKKDLDNQTIGEFSRTSTAEEPTATTTISASAKEIKVSSPVLGVIILIISLLFFYLYLVYVFPIEEIL